MISAATGQSYEDHLRETLFEPLGMRDTGCDRRDRILKHRAAG